MIKIIGGGLAGVETAYALLSRGYEVDLYEMRPQNYSPAHKTSSLAELVCSNSLKSDLEDTASGVLKREMREFGSVVLMAAEKALVPAGGALGVDRVVFSAEIERILNKFEGFHLHKGVEIDTLPDDGDIKVVATGPLTSDKMSEALKTVTGDEYLNFFDAEAPIVSADSIDYNKAFFAARYGKGDADYLNAPMTKDEYLAFYDALQNAEKAKQEVGGNYFEGCMPIEVMAKGGVDSLRFGPLRPIGLNHPITGEKYYAVLQLRKENVNGDAYNLVGFQTSLTFPEQRRVFGLIPALANAEYLRYGVMHRNTFINAPQLLDDKFNMKKRNDIYIAGQLSGVEGYMESAMSGMIVGLAIACRLRGIEMPSLPQTTIMGALARHVSTNCIGNFQPMNANFGVLPAAPHEIRGKQDRKSFYAKRAIADIKKYVASSGLGVKEE